MNQNTANKVKKFQAVDFDEKAIFLCQFCGGVQCSQEDYRQNKVLPNAIEGLHSNWITPQILAMQRPSERLMKEHNIAKKFKQKGINTVLNLQQPGQHPYCGDGVLPNVGFSYRNEDFFAEGIKCFNESWEDMTATTFSHMMKIMNIFDSSLKGQGKISVHCHAGRGRTLLVICSWLIYHNRMTAENVIKHAKQKRQGVLSSSSQRQFLKYFEIQLNNRWKSYHSTGQILQEQKLKTYSSLISWQTEALLRRQKKWVNHNSAASHYLLSQLQERVKQNHMEILYNLLASNYRRQIKETVKQQLDTKISHHKSKINKLQFNSLKQEKDTKVLVQLLLDFYEQLPYTLLTNHTIQNIQQILENNKSINELLANPLLVQQIGLQAISSIVYLLHFIQILISQVKQPQQKKISEQSEQLISIDLLIDILYIRIAMVLISKKKYFSAYYHQINPREGKFIKYAKKIKAKVNSDVLFIANILQEITQSLPQNQEKLSKLLFQVKMVDTNIYSFTRQKTEELLSGQPKDSMFRSSAMKFKQLE